MHFIQKPKEEVFQPDAVFSHLSRAFKVEGTLAVTSYNPMDSGRPTRSKKLDVELYQQSSLVYKVSSFVNVLSAWLNDNRLPSCLKIRSAILRSCTLPSRTVTNLVCISVSLVMSSLQPFPLLYRSVTKLHCLPSWTTSTGLRQL